MTFFICYDNDNDVGSILRVNDVVGREEGGRWKKKKFLNDKP